MGDELAVGHDGTRRDAAGAEDRDLRRDNDELGEPPDDDLVSMGRDHQFPARVAPKQALWWNG